MITATWHGHSCYTIDIDGTKIVLDPFFSGSPVAKVSADDVEADFVLLTHGHADHFGDAIEIARRTGATIVAPNELAIYCGEQGVTAHPMHIGGGQPSSMRAAVPSTSAIPADFCSRQS